MRQAEFRYNKLKLGTIFHTEDESWFTYRLTDQIVSHVNVRPETLIALLEEIRFDAAQESFDFDSYITYKTNDFYFEEVK